MPSTSRRGRKWAVVQRDDVYVRPPSSPSTFPSGRKEWAVVSCESYLSACTQHFHVWEERIGCIYRDVDGIKLVHSTFTSWKEEWTLFIEMSLLGKGLYSMFTSGKNSGRLFHEMTSIVLLRFSSMSSHRRKFTPAQTIRTPSNAVTSPLAQIFSTGAIDGIESPHSFNFNFQCNYLLDKFGQFNVQSVSTFRQFLVGFQV